MRTQLPPRSLQSCHGLEAIKTVPGLYEDYIYQLGVTITNARFAIGNLAKFNYELDEEDTAFTVDRNYICGALAKYLNEHFSSSSFSSLYETTALFVDADTKTVMVRNLDKSGEIKTIPYDMILGCDGIRSVVRNAFITNHRGMYTVRVSWVVSDSCSLTVCLPVAPLKRHVDFEFDIKGDFGIGKSVHITSPKNVKPGTFMFLANCVPNVSAFVLPERDGMQNFACGHTLNAPCDEELRSDDPKVVSEYFRQHFTAFDMDYEEMGREWVKQGWSTIQMVHANFYHSAKIQALLLGDAAHATCPNIGQGMNTALEDAAVLNGLLDEYSEDWDAVLPVFSELRVKEGNALTELSFHSFSLSLPMQMSILFRQNVRRFLNNIFPVWLVEPEPMLAISRGMKLSEAYDKMIQLGYLQKSKRINHDIMQEHFEKTTGMVKERKSSSLWPVLVLGGAVAGAFYLHGQKK